MCTNNQLPKKKFKLLFLFKSFSLFNSKNILVIKRLWNIILKKYFLNIVVVVFLLLIFASIDGYTISLLKNILDQGFIKKNLSVLKFISIQVMVLFSIKAVSLYFNTTILYNVSLKVSREMRKKLFKKIVDLDINYFEKNSSGTLVARVVTDAMAAGEILRQIFTVFLTQLAIVIAMVVVMIYTVPKLSMVALLTLPLAYSFIRLLNKRIRRIYQKAVMQVESLQSYLIQVVQNIPILKIYTKEKYETEKASKIFNTFYHLQKKTYATQAAAKPIIEMITGVIMATTMFCGGYLINHNLITLGEFVVFFAALFSIYRPLKMLSGVVPQIQATIISAERLFLTYDAIPDVQDKPDSKDLVFSKGFIEFKCVSFIYKSTDKSALHNISFNVNPGEIVALVGHSGAGKTTIVKLLSRFYDVDSGEILIDNQNIKYVTQTSFRKYISMVTQDILMFDDTIQNNIAYGSNYNPDEVTLEEIIEAAKKADAHDFIMNMPQQYQTLVGERGIKLSGGQKQRISIARAVLKNAPILLLDEATSSLDTESERLVQEALYLLMKNRTTIVIAHRLSTIINANKILVVENGKIVQQGSHKELINQAGGRYKALYDIQFNSV